MPSLSKHVSNSTAYAVVIELLLRRGGTTQEIREQSGLGDTTVRKLIQALRRRGILRVALWKRDSIGRPVLPVWSFGTAPDVARQPAISKQDRLDAYNQKRREIGERLGVPMRHVRLRDHLEEMA